MVYKQTYNWGASSCLILWVSMEKLWEFTIYWLIPWGLSIVFSAYAIYPKKK